MKTLLRLSKLTLAGLIACMLCSESYAQETQEESDESVLVASQNPISSMVSLPLQFNWNFGLGDYNRTQTLINIQPVLPTKLTKKWNLINRIIIPVTVQPDLGSETGSTGGLTCMNMDGEIMWKTKRDPDFNKGSMIYADGLILATDGAKKLYLIEPDPTAFKSLASVWANPKYRHHRHNFCISEISLCHRTCKFKLQTFTST